MFAKRHLAVALAVAALGVGACGNGEDRPGSSGSVSGSASGSMAHDTTTTAFKPAEATTKVDVAATEYVFQGIPSSVAGPNVFFTVKNTGKEEHELEVVAPDGEPVGEVHVEAGDTKTLAVKLTPGKYVAQCLVEDDGKTHASKGMKTEFTVT